jgi:hypothetical protein
MADRIFESFLASQAEDAQALDRASDLLAICPVGPSPSDRYILDYRCTGLVRDPAGQIVEASHFLVGVRFPADYLRVASTFNVLTWLGPPTTWHPNISNEFPVICVGHLEPGTGLVDLAYQIHAVITWQKVTMDESNALNRAACQWARGHRDRFPVDRRPLKRRQPSFLFVDEPERSRLRVDSH